MEDKQSKPLGAMAKSKVPTTQVKGEPATTSKSKGGRPRKTCEEKRSKAIQVRLSPANYKYIEKLAEARNISMAKAILDHCRSDIKAITPEQEVLLRKIATLINTLDELAKKAHIEGVQSVAALVIPLVQELKQLLSRYSK